MEQIRFSSGILLFQSNQDWISNSVGRQISWRHTHSGRKSNFTKKVKAKPVTHGMHVNILLKKFQFDPDKTESNRIKKDRLRDYFHEPIRKDQKNLNLFNLLASVSKFFGRVTKTRWPFMVPDRPSKKVPSS